MSALVVQECHVEAYPPPAIKWYRSVGDALILLNNNQHYQSVFNHQHLLQSDYCRKMTSQCLRHN